MLVGWSVSGCGVLRDTTPSAAPEDNIAVLWFVIQLLLSIATIKIAYRFEIAMTIELNAVK